ncbi:hypothetical protein AAG570_001272 [Ranatra chinensis]|uniref:Uncharacterized protein n=1 Tax=Ranatra chinensis TaxID=642074 RepID=A0ABD0YTZ4_9HEMI
MTKGVVTMRPQYSAKGSLDTNPMQKRRAREFIPYPNLHKNRARRSKPAKKEKYVAGRPHLKVRGITGGTKTKGDEGGPILNRKKNEKEKIHCRTEHNNTAICYHGHYLYKVKLPDELFSGGTLEAIMSSIYENVEPHPYNAADFSETLQPDALHELPPGTNLEDLKGKISGELDTRGFEMLAPAADTSDLSSALEFVKQNSLQADNRRLQDTSGIIAHSKFGRLQNRISTFNDQVVVPIGPSGYKQDKQEPTELEAIGMNRKVPTLHTEDAAEPLQFIIEVPASSSSKMFSAKGPLKRLSGNPGNTIPGPERVPIIERGLAIRKRDSLLMCHKKTTTTRRPSVNEGKQGVCCLPQQFCKEHKPKCPCSRKPKPCVPITTCPPEKDLVLCPPPSRCPVYELVTAASPVCSTLSDGAELNTSDRGKRLTEVGQTEDSAYQSDVEKKDKSPKVMFRTKHKKHFRKFHRPRRHRHQSSRTDIKFRKPSHVVEGTVSPEKLSLAYNNLQLTKRRQISQDARLMVLSKKRNRKCHGKNAAMSAEEGCKCGRECSCDCSVHGQSRHGHKHIERDLHTK